MKPIFKESFEYDINHSQVGIEIKEKFNILNEIYRSDQSIVIKIEDKLSHQTYVLKAIRKREDVTFEVDILKQLNIIGVNKLIDCFESDYYLYLIEHFIQGQNLEQFIKTVGPLNEEQAKDLILKISEVLSRLHQFDNRKIIFRDLKPSNIMLTPEGEIVLIDIITIREMKSNQTQDTFLIGSKGYTAPEAYGYMQTSEKSDIYSLGATLFYLLTGVQPANIMTYADYFSQSKTPFKRVIEKATSFNPEDRFKTVDEFMKAIMLGRVPISIKRLLPVWFGLSLVLSMIIMVLIYNPFDKSHQNQEEALVGESFVASDITIENMEIIKQGLSFERYDTGELKIEVDREALPLNAQDFSLISVGTGYSEFTEETVLRDAKLTVEEKGYQYYSNEGFLAMLEDRNHVQIILFSLEGKPLAYYFNNNITGNHTSMQEERIIEIDENTTVYVYKTYAKVLLSESLLTKVKAISLWGSQDDFSEDDLEVIENKIASGESIQPYMEDGVDTGYGTLGTFDGQNWKIFLLNDQNQIVSVLTIDKSK